MIPNGLNLLHGDEQVSIEHFIRYVLLQEVEHLATVAGLVLAGIGVTLVPAMTLFHFDRPGLVIKPISGKVPARQLFLVRKKGKSLSVAAQTFYDLLLTHTPEPYSRVR